MSRLCEKQISIACFVGSELNNILHWKVQLLLTCKTLLSWKLELLLFSIFEKSDVSSANILHDAVVSSGKSFIWIRNKRGSKTEPYGTPAVTLSHD